MMMTTWTANAADAAARRAAVAGIRCDRIIDGSLIVRLATKQLLSTPCSRISSKESFKEASSQE